METVVAAVALILLVVAVAIENRFSAQVELHATEDLKTKTRRVGQSIASESSLLEKLKQAWKRDPLAVLGVGSAVLAFLLWAWPSPWPSPWAWVWWHGFFYFGPWFPTERLPAAAAFLAASIIILLLRRR